MSLGLCCHWLDDHGNNALKTSELRLGRLRQGGYTEEHVRTTYLNNVKRHIAFMPTVIAAGVRVFRLTSSLFSLCDQVPREWWDNDELRSELATFGSICLAADLRVTTHPGQFVVLSSDTEHVVDNAIKELNMHAWVFDQMGLPRTPHHAINVHGGKGDRLDRLCQTIERLELPVRSRLTLENDESSYSVGDLLEVHVRTQVPVVLDTHHHTFNPGGLELPLAHSACMETWLPSGAKPLQHIANTEPGLENGSFSLRRKHSNFIHTIPDVQLEALKANEIDVDVEAKMKNVAVFKMSSDFNIPL